MGNAPTVNMVQIKNRSFEEGTVKHPDFPATLYNIHIPTSWGLSVSGTTSVSTVFAYTKTNDVTDGIYGYYISISNTGNRNVHLILSQAINLNGWDILTFDIISRSGPVWVKLGGQTVYSSTSYVAALEQVKINLASTGLSGVVLLEISTGYNYDTAVYGSTNLFVDNFKLGIDIPLPVIINGSFEDGFIDGSNDSTGIVDTNIPTGWGISFVRGTPANYAQGKVTTTTGGSEDPYQYRMLNNIFQHSTYGYFELSQVVTFTGNGILLLERSYFSGLLSVWIGDNEVYSEESLSGTIATTKTISIDVSPYHGALILAIRSGYVDTVLRINQHQVYIDNVRFE